MLRTKLPLASGCAGGLFGAVWIGFWSLGTLLFDGFLIWYCCQQTLALSWPTAPGTITHSEVQAETDSEGTSYKPDVRYRFVVNGVEHSGEGIRLFPAAMGRAHAEAMVRRYPVGKQVPVRYRPQSPDWSLLEAGIGPMEAFLALFLTPFNVIMLGGWAYARNSLLPASRPGLPPGAKRAENYEGFTLLLYETRPITIAAATLLGVTFAGVFLNILLIWLAPAVPLVYGLWLAAIGLSTYAFFRQRDRAMELRVSTLRGSFEIVRPGGAQVRSGLLSELSGVQVKHRIRKDGDGDVQSSFSVVLKHVAKGQPSRTRLLIRNWSENEAERLARWLAAELRTPLLDKPQPGPKAAFV